MIGSRVARIGEAFGMKINIYSRDKDAAQKSDFERSTARLPGEQRVYR